METLEPEPVMQKNAVEEAEKVQELGESEDYKLEVPLPEQPEETISEAPKVGAVEDPKDEEEDEPPLSSELQHGYQILRGLMADSNKSVNWPFMDPVDASSQGLEDYYDKTLSPMWLKKMKEKFDKRIYETITEFVADFRLMLENCYRFNGPDHYVSKRGQRLETMLEQKLALLSRELRLKTSIEATASQMKDSNRHGEIGLGSRRRNKNLVPHDSSLLLNQLREQEVQREKDLRKQIIADKKAAQEAYMSELLEWENELLGESFRTHIRAMWELPQIGHFLYLCQEPLNIGEVSQHELERSFCMPRESSTLQRVMTALLSTPHQRTKFDKKKMMSYNTWEAKLRIKLRNWYKVFDDHHCDIDKAAEKLGLDPYFFDVVGKRNPLEKKRFHQLSHYRQIWIVKSLCDNCLENQESLRDAIEFQPFEDQRDYLLGVDEKGNRYIHFPQFCGADLRIYRQSKFKEPVYSASEPEDNSNKRKNTNAEENEIKTPKKKRKKKRSQPKKRKTGGIKREQISKPVKGQNGSDASGDEAVMSDTSLCSSSVTSVNVNNSCCSTRESSPAVFDRTHTDTLVSTKAHRKMRNGLVRDFEKEIPRLSPKKKLNTGSENNFGDMEQFSDDSQLRSLSSLSSGFMTNENSDGIASSNKSKNRTKLGENGDVSDTSGLAASSHWCDDDNSTCDSTLSDSLPGAPTTTVPSRSTDASCDNNCFRTVEDSSDKCHNDLQSVEPEVNDESDCTHEKDSIQQLLKNIKTEPPDEVEENSKTDDNVKGDNITALDNICNIGETVDDNSDIAVSIVGDSCAIKSEVEFEQSACSQQDGEEELSSTVKKEESSWKSEQSTKASDSNSDEKEAQIKTLNADDDKHSETDEGLVNIKKENTSVEEDSSCGVSFKTESVITEYRPDHTYSNIKPSVPDIKQESEEEEEEEELVPDVGEFELVGDTVEDLRNLVSKFAEPEPIVVKKGKKKKVIKPPPRKKCIIELHAQLEFLLHELEPWEGKLVQATKKARLRMRKEKDEYKEEKEDIWESESEETGSSGDSDEASDTDSESDKPDLLIIKEKTTKLLKKKTCVQDSDSSSMDISLETDISSRGRIRKRRIIPNNTEDQGIKKKRSDATSSESAASGHVPNILQRQNKAQPTAVSTAVTQTTVVTQKSLQTASDYVKFHSSQNPGEIILQPSLKQGGSQQRILYGVSPQTLMNLRLITSKTTPQEFTNLTVSGVNSSGQPYIKIEPRPTLKPGAVIQTKTELANKLSQSGNNKIQSHPVMQQLLAKQPLQAHSFAPTHSSVKKIKVEPSIDKSQNLSSSKQPQYLSIPPGYRLVGPTTLLSSTTTATVRNSQTEIVTNSTSGTPVIANQTQVILSGQAATIVGYDDKGNKVQYVTNVNSLPAPVLTQIIRGNSLKIEATHSIITPDSSQDSPCKTSPATLHTGTTVSPSNILSQSKQVQKYASNMTVKALLAAQNPNATTSSKPPFFCLTPPNPADLKPDVQMVAVSAISQMLQNKNDSTPTVVKILPTAMSNKGVEMVKSCEEKEQACVMSKVSPRQLSAITQPQQVILAPTQVANIQTADVKSPVSTVEKQIIAAVPQVSGNQLVLSLQVPTTAVNQLGTIKLPSKAVLDSAVKAVVTSVVTSLPTVHMKVPSPSTLPTIQPRKNVTKTIQSMKSPITVTPKLESKVRSATTIPAPICNRSGQKCVPSTGNIITSTAMSGMGVVVTQAHPGNKVATIIQQSADIRNVVKVTPQTFLTSQGYLQGFVSPQGIIIPQQNIKMASTTTSPASVSTPVVTLHSAALRSLKPEIRAAGHHTMISSSEKQTCQQISPALKLNIPRQNIAIPTASVMTSSYTTSQINGRLSVNSVTTNTSYTITHKKDSISSLYGQVASTTSKPSEIQFSPGGQHFVNAVPPQGYVELVLPKSTISSVTAGSTALSSNPQQGSASEIVRQLAAVQMMNTNYIANKSPASTQKYSAEPMSIHGGNYFPVSSVQTPHNLSSQTVSNLMISKNLKNSNPALSAALQNIQQKTAINVSPLHNNVHNSQSTGSVTTAQNLDSKIILSRENACSIPTTSQSGIKMLDQLLPLQTNVSPKSPLHSPVISSGSNLLASHSLQSNVDRLLSAGTSTIVNVKPESLNQISNLSVPGIVPGGPHGNISPNKLLLYNLGGQLVTPHGVPVTVEKGVLKVLPMATIKVGMETVTFRAPENVVNYKHGKNVANSPKSPVSPVLHQQGAQCHLGDPASLNQAINQVLGTNTQLNTGQTGERVLSLSVPQNTADNIQNYKMIPHSVKDDNYVVIGGNTNQKLSPTIKSNIPCVTTISNPISPPNFSSTHSGQCSNYSLPIDCSLQTRSVKQTSDRTEYSPNVQYDINSHATDQQKQVHLQNFLQQNTAGSAVKRLAFPPRTVSLAVSHQLSAHQAAKVLNLVDSLKTSLPMDFPHSASVSNIAQDFSHVRSKSTTDLLIDKSSIANSSFEHQTNERTSVSGKTELWNSHSIQDLKSVELAGSANNTNLISVQSLSANQPASLGDALKLHQITKCVNNASASGTNEGGVHKRYSGDYSESNPGDTDKEAALNLLSLFNQNVN